MSRSMPTKAERQMDALYAELPRLDCKGLCHDSCGPVLMTSVEWKRIKKRVGHTPRGRADLKCPMLTGVKKCSVYAIRPSICRLWGLVETMPCHYGCQPERYLTDAEGKDFLRRASELAGDRAE